MIPRQTFRLTRAEGRGHRFRPSESRNTLDARRTRRVRKSIWRRFVAGLVMISAPYPTLAMKGGLSPITAGAPSSIVRAGVRNPSPLPTFKVGFMNVREARESGLRLKAWVRHRAKPLAP